MVFSASGQTEVSLTGAALCSASLQRGRHHEEEHRRVEEVDDQQQPAPSRVSGNIVRSYTCGNYRTCALAWFAKMTKQQKEPSVFFCC